MRPVIDAPQAAVLVTLAQAATTATTTPATSVAFPSRSQIDVSQTVALLGGIIVVLLFLWGIGVFLFSPLMDALHNRRQLRNIEVFNARAREATKEDRDRIDALEARADMAEEAGERFDRLFIAQGEALRKVEERVKDVPEMIVLVRALTTSIDSMRDDGRHTRREITDLGGRVSHMSGLIEGMDRARRTGAPDPRPDAEQVERRHHPLTDGEAA